MRSRSGNRQTIETAKRFRKMCINDGSRDSRAIKGYTTTDFLFGPFRNGGLGVAFACDVLPLASRVTPRTQLKSRCFGARAEARDLNHLITKGEAARARAAGSPAAARLRGGLRPSLSE